MRKNIFFNILSLCIALVFLMIALHFILLMKVRLDKYVDNQMYRWANNSATLHPNHIGEKIVYDVRLGKLYLGQSRFTNVANAKLNDKTLNVMLFETRLARFVDKEKIYSDPQTLLPMRVERDILQWLVRERIIEDYDQNNFTVTIIKHRRGDPEKTLIKKDSPIHNAILLPYYVRRIPNLEVGRVIIVNLPTRRFEIKLVSQEEIEVPAGTFQAYHFTSTPKQIDIWISTDERRIPIKIQGTGLFSYSLVMREYNF